MAGTTYGYVRVSTLDQNEAPQLAAMREFGVAEGNIIVGKISGKDLMRPHYQRLVRALQPGDVLVVKSIDRLGRNYEEILEQWSFITKKCQTAIVVLDMPLLDTRQGRDLIGTLIADIVLQLLNYVAKRRGKTSARGRRKASRRQKPKAYTSDRDPSLCRTPLRSCGRHGGENE